jgi:hypothetical protein
VQGRQGVQPDGAHAAARADAGELFSHQFLIRYHKRFAPLVKLVVVHRPIEDSLGGKLGDVPDKDPFRMQNVARFISTKYVEKWILAKSNAYNMYSVSYSYLTDSLGVNPSEFFLQDLCSWLGADFPGRDKCLEGIEGFQKKKRAP